MRLSHSRLAMAACALAASTLIARANSFKDEQPPGSYRVDIAAPANVGEVDKEGIDIYQSQMRSAMSIADPRLRDAAIISARLQLVQAIGKPLTAETIAELDGILDIGGASPQLGAIG